MRTRSLRRLSSLPLAGRLAGIGLGAVAVFATGSALVPSTAQACGCFAPPDPSVPIVQAGERILFAHENGEVLAHIQIQYSGKPGEFGWLLPLPAVPKDRTGKDGIELGVDELFTQLTSTTQPKYRLKRVYPDCGGKSASRNTAGLPPLSAADSAGGFDMGAPGAPPSPLVVQSSIGPYDFAILKADNKDLMLKWLTDNRYFVPAGTEQASAPYIRPGAFFLALKLKAGESSGALQPVVLRYKSDLPMIPLVLTSVAAQPNMGIQVWMLGAGRAIPRNYYHTVINDAQINWFTSGANYNDVIIKAVGEADGKHSFVTEYAGASTVMRNLLNAPGRFGNLDTLALVKDPVSFVQGALGGGFSATNSQFTGTMERFIPLPAALKAQGVTLATYYARIDFYLNTDRRNNPAKYTDIEAALAAFDGAMVVPELRTRVVEPTLDAGAAFDRFAYLTRLYTTLSPEDMNKDPVFSYNPSLSDYANLHEATLTYNCSGFFSKEMYSSATLETASGFKRLFTVNEADSNQWSGLSAPFSQQIQTLREVGEPEVLVDNTSAIRQALGTGGCSAAPGSGAGAASALGLLLGSTALLLRRRRSA
ncbi:MAG: DUF2330 domain-containing protein [Polyangia bacterium]